MKNNRYYNENPQVTYLLEKIEEQAKVIESLQEQLANMEYRYEKRSDNFMKLLKQVCKYARSPWYKRLNFVFEL